MGQKWNECLVLGCDAETLADTLPKGLRGTPQASLDNTCLALQVLVPSYPHQKHEAFQNWMEEQGILPKQCVWDN